MVDSDQKEIRKRDFLYVIPLWLLSLIVPDADDLYSYRSKEFKRRELFYLGALLFLPLIWRDPHFHHLMVLAGIYAILALGLSLFLGYAGQISLGHAAFFGIGAYTTAILTTRYGFPPFLAFWTSPFIAAIAAYLIGRPILKLKGYFLAIATLGFGEIFKSLSGVHCFDGVASLESLTSPFFLSRVSLSILISNSIISPGECSWDSSSIRRTWSAQRWAGPF
jgi:ABC-type branched-subunit amino acid transport system permease subunit